MNIELIIIISVVFIVLCITHYAALKVGWNMGINGDINKVMSNPKKAKKSKPFKFKDPYREAMWEK